VRLDHVGSSKTNGTATLVYRHFWALIFWLLKTRGKYTSAVLLAERNFWLQGLVRFFIALVIVKRLL
jgi:hypothetical protein